MFELVLVIAFFEKIGIADLQIFQTVCKVFFGDIAEKSRQRAKFLPAKCLWFCRHITADDGLLMEDIVI